MRFVPALVVVNVLFAHARVVSPSTKKSIGEHEFDGYGSHHSLYPSSYLTVAAAIGGSVSEINVFLSRLDQVLKSAPKLG